MMCSRGTTSEPFRTGMLNLLLAFSYTSYISTTHYNFHRLIAKP